jgi:hypothetical protein
VDYKNKQLMEKIMFESSLRYHTKKEGYLNSSWDINELHAILLGASHRRRGNYDKLF